MAYDPKLLESWFRFMADATKTQAQASEMMDAMANATSPEGWAEVMARFAPDDPAAPKAESFKQWSAAYWEAFGFVPKVQYEELKEKYLGLKAKLEAAEREARQAKQLLTMKGQEERAKEAVDAWSTTLNATLQAQSQWWTTWLGSSDPENSEKTVSTKKTKSEEESS